MDERLDDIALSRPRWQGYLALAFALVAAGLAVRVLRLDATEAWLDEICALDLASRPLGELFAALRSSEPHPPLYFFLLSASIELFGPAIWVARLPSMVAGALLVPVVWVAAAKWRGQVSGAWAGAFAALSPLLVYYSVEARQYMPVTLLGALSTALLLHAIRSGRGRAFAAYAGVTVLALLTHYYAFFLLPLLPLALVAMPPHGRSRRYGLIALGFLALVTVLVWLLLMRSGASVGTRALDFFWAGTRPWRAPLESLALFAPGVVFPRYLGYLGLSGAPLWVEVVSLTLCAALLALAFVGRRDEAPGLRARHSEGLVWLGHLLLPILLPVIASTIGRPIYLVGRYEVIAAPALAVLLAAGAVRLQTRRWPLLAPAGTLALIGALAATNLGPLALAEDPRHRTRLTDRLLSELRPQDLVITLNLTGPLVAYAAQREGRRIEQAYFPAGAAEHPCWLNYREEADDEQAREAEAKDLVQRALAHTAQGGTAWVVTTMDPRKKRVFAWALNRHLLMGLTEAGLVPARRARAGEWGLLGFRTAMD